MSYHDKIDPIGESPIDKPEEETDVLHDLSVNIFTDLDRLKKEVEIFDQTIKDYETYTRNQFLLNRLKMQRQRLKSLIDNVETNFDKFNNLTS